jgi:thiol-disulfide isomerase/thioredoxin
MLLRNLLACAILLAAVPTFASEEGHGPEIGQPSPNLIGRTLDDKSYRLKNDKGSPKVINFFWIGCKPCRQEMPELAQLEKQYTGVKFIAVHTQAEKPEVVEKFVQSLSGAPSNIVLTSGGLQDSFHFFGLPHTIVLDSNNVVLMNLSGYTPNNMQRLTTMLQELTKH